MTSRLAVIAINAVEPERIADFWCSVLGWQEVAREPGAITIGAADGSWPTIDIVTVPDRKVVFNRLHLDLRADGVSAAEELDRLLALGARHADVGQPPDATWVVLADPEGNEFCLLSRTVQEVWNEHHLEPLGLGPVIEVDTSRAVDVPALADRIRDLAPDERVFGQG